MITHVEALDAITKVFGGYDGGVAFLKCKALLDDMAKAADSDERAAALLHAWLLVGRTCKQLLEHAP